VLRWSIKKYYAYVSRYRYSKIVKKLKNKKKISITFFVTSVSKWKYHELYRKLLDESFFEEVNVCILPLTHIQKELSDKEYLNCVKWFKINGYNTIERNEINEHTDIVFYSDPYDFIEKRFRIENMSKHFLCCYSQYSYMALNAYEGFYNLNFHNMLWRFFSESNYHSNLSKKYCGNKGSNVIVSGYPYSEILLKETENSKGENRRIKFLLIWAPHHTIEQENGQQSNFLKFSDIMQSFSEKYKDKIDFVFKPHPNLKSRLYKSEHLGWGKAKTDDYYTWWDSQENTQCHEGEYTKLFQESDGLIHDSASFVFEYMLTKKPSLFLIDKKVEQLDFNELGKKAVKRSYITSDAHGIESFIQSVIIDKCDYKIDGRVDFIFNDLDVDLSNPPSNVIINELKSELC
ncbi:CDP-glycerol glycerophosphotransferase family protein, partial [Vibrio parahaemolyticus]